MNLRPNSPLMKSTLQKEVSALWKLTWPMLLGQLATVGMGFVDVVMTGHLSANDLAATSNGASLWVIILVTISGSMMAINSIVAHEVGSGDLTRVPHIVRQAMWKGLGVGLSGMLLLNMATAMFAHLELATEVHDKAVSFVRIVSLGMPAYAMFRALYGYSASLNQTKPLMVMSIGALLLNIGVNWVFVYGKLGMPQLGAAGCAIGTALGQWLMLIAMLGWIKHARVYQSSYPFGKWEWPHLPEIFGMLKLGLPIGITYFAEVSAFAAVAFLVARLGAVTQSAHQIALNFSSIVFMVPMSLGIALITRVGQALGESDPHQARFISQVGVGMALLYAMLSASVIGIFPWHIAAIYTSDPEIQKLAASLLLFAALFQLSDAAQVSASCAIRGYKVTRQPMLIHLTAFWGFSLPVGYILGEAPAWAPWKPAQAMGAAGYWIGLVLGLTVAAFGLVWYLNRLSSQRAAVVKKAAG
jgi:MATE family multidrug resistance protein